MAYLLQQRIPEIEPYIIKDPDLIIKYALHIIKGRWRQAEDVLLNATDHKKYYRIEEYAKNVIKGLWPEAEKLFKKTRSINGLLKIAKVTKQRNAKLERMLLRNPERHRFSLINYAQAINDRWPEIEPYIMKDPKMAYEYAKNIIKGRWPEAEPYIMKNPQWAYEYAKDIIKGRWSEAEPYIMRSSVAVMYRNFVLKR